MVTLVILPVLFGTFWYFWQVDYLTLFSLIFSSIPVWQIVSEKPFPDFCFWYFLIPFCSILYFWQVDCFTLIFGGSQPDSTQSPDTTASSHHWEETFESLAWAPLAWACGLPPLILSRDQPDPTRHVDSWFLDVLFLVYLSKLQIQILLEV